MFYTFYFLLQIMYRELKKTLKAVNKYSVANGNKNFILL